MGRTIKNLFTCLATAAALAVFASAAPAAEFHSEVEHTTLSGAQVTASGDVFTFEAGTVRCASIQYDGTIANKTTSGLSLKPNYGFKGCTAFGFVNTDMWAPTSCNYVFSASAINSFSISCGAGEQITIEAWNCTVRFGSQILNGASYDNAGSGTGREVTITVSVTGMIYSQEPKNFPLCTSGTFFNGKYTGSATIKGFDTSGAQVGFWHA